MQFHVKSGLSLDVKVKLLIICTDRLLTLSPFCLNIFYTHWTSKGADTDFLSKADKGKNLYARTSSVNVVVTSENPLYVSTMTFASRSGIGGRSAIKSIHSNPSSLITTVCLFSWKVSLHLTANIPLLSIYTKIQLKVNLWSEITWFTEHVESVLKWFQ